MKFKTINIKSLIKRKYLEFYLGKSLHKRLIVLHASSSVDENNIVHVLLAPIDSLMRNSGRILAISALEKRDNLLAVLGRMQRVQRPGVRLELLDGARTERITRGYQHSISIINLL